MVKAVDGVSFNLRQGETLGIVGESGCGKTMTALSLLRLIPRPAGRIESGEILLNGEDLVQKSEDEMREVRGKRARTRARIAPAIRPHRFICVSFYPQPKRGPITYAV